MGDVDDFVEVRNGRKNAGLDRALELSGLTELEDCKSHLIEPRFGCISVYTRIKTFLGFSVMFLDYYGQGVAAASILFELGAERQLGDAVDHNRR